MVNWHDALVGAVVRRALGLMTEWLLREVTPELRDVIGRAAASLARWLAQRQADRRTDADQIVPKTNQSRGERNNVSRPRLLLSTRFNSDHLLPATCHSNEPATRCSSYFLPPACASQMKQLITHKMPI